MPEDFQQTVNLKEKMMKAAPARQPSFKSGSIENIYGREEAKREDLHKISKPDASRFLLNEKMIKTAVIALGIILAFFVLKAFVFGGEDAKEEKNTQTQTQPGWYSVKLSNGEMFYGQVSDVSADPLVVNNVYYDFDQLKQKEGLVSDNATGNLRLVKRGKETYGPDGAVNIVRAQVLYLEQLKDDSKVLQAILGYENK